MNVNLMSFHKSITCFIDKSLSFYKEVFSWPSYPNKLLHQMQLRSLIKRQRRKCGRSHLQMLKRRHRLIRLNLKAIVVLSRKSLKIRGGSKTSSYSTQLQNAYTETYNKVSGCLCGLEIIMLNWIITFFLLSVIAAVLGFGGLAGTFAEIAKFIAYVFIALFMASLVYSLITGKRPTPLV